MPDHDPHRWLESLDSPDVARWVDEQNARTQAQLDADPRFVPLAEDILATLRDTRQIPFFAEHAGWLYNFHQDETHPRGIYRRTTLDAYRANAQDWHTVLDLDALAAAEEVDWYLDGVSHYTLQPTRVLLSLTPGGSDATVTREYDLEAQAFVAGGFSFPYGKNHIAWRDLDSVFVCPAWEDEQLSRAGYPREVWLLERGQAWDAAVPLLKLPEDAMMAAAWRFLDAGTSCSRREPGEDKADGAQRPRQYTEYGEGASTAQRGHRPAQQAEPTPFDIVEASDSFYSKTYYHLAADHTLTALPLPPKSEIEAYSHGDLIVKLADDWNVQGHSYAAGTLLAVACDAASGQLGRIVALFEPGERQSVEMVEATLNLLAVIVLDNVKSRLVTLRRAGGEWQEFANPLPQDGVIEFADQPWQSDLLYYSYSDFLTPAGLYRIDLARDTEPEVLRQQPAAFDASGYVAEQWHANAPDGTAIPYFVVRPRELPFDGSAPTLLYGYGGFEVPMMPYYMDNFGPQWLAKGGVFAVANIRGGGEFGPAWHQAAQGVKRAVSFDDFVAVAEDLIARGVTSPRRLGIEGGSNGGLLVGAAMTRRPDLFNAVVCEVPLLDMLRYTELLAGASWIDEYGDPEDPETRVHLAAYSPYHQISPEARYPLALFTTSAKDDRVHPAHARKMVARLAEHGHDALFIETDAGGHSGNTGQQQTAAELARVLVYLYRQLMD
ncbi:prolyl oligopeptidase family serine peptidase [Pseudogulbenkiania subflava]|uniref:Prolyl oligopeptidase n=1 Tax=Pseudogulbenkiania subflava DSM 22618 TaxID=1123014 RepID=A0A1Y6BA72_9NEIS|nr:prolyl oligopeptidase family serine peptidase [Pseudogulbenkiania subflava]SME92899.1 prolyl oligopeptidase [Pseudogulbenkiania subflava DSM 22618]